MYISLQMLAYWKLLVEYVLIYIYIHKHDVSVVKNQYTIQTLINIMYARDLILSQALLEKDKGRTDVGQKEYGRNCRNKHDILMIT